MKQSLKLIRSGIALIICFVFVMSLVACTNNVSKDNTTESTRTVDTSKDIESTAETSLETDIVSEEEVGKWIISDNMEISREEELNFYLVMDEGQDGKYIPIASIASKIEDGISHRYLCTRFANGETSFAFVELHQKPDTEVILNSKIVFDNPKDAENWEITNTHFMNSNLEEFFAKTENVNYKPIAVVSTYHGEYPGYAFLCELVKDSNQNVSSGVSYSIDENPINSEENDEPEENTSVEMSEDNTDYIGHSENTSVSQSIPDWCIIYICETENETYEVQYCFPVES